MLDFFSRLGSYLENWTSIGSASSRSFIQAPSEPVREPLSFCMTCSVLNVTFTALTVPFYLINERSAIRQRYTGCVGTACPFQLSWRLTPPIILHCSFPETPIQEYFSAKSDCRICVCLLFAIVEGARPAREGAECRLY